MTGWLRSILGGPRTAGPPTTVRAFAAGEPTLSTDGVVGDETGWQVAATGDRTVRLFEVADPGLERCRLTYRAALRCDGLDGRAYLEMWCRLPGQGEFFSKGIAQAVSGTTGWVACEVPFLLRKGQRPDLVKLNLAVEGAGRVWIRDVELLAAPLG
jgi:hypothetical protein